MLRDREYYPADIDLFAVGKLLFMMATGYPPFSHATEEDKYY